MSNPTRKAPTKDMADPLVGSILDKLGFSPDNVVQAASSNPLLFRDAIDFRQKCLSERTRAKAILERTEAECELAIRKDHRDRGEKITEGNIEILTTLDADVATAKDLFSKAEEADEYSRLIVEAVRMQRDCLKIVADLTWNDISIQRAVDNNSGKVNDTRERLRDARNARYPGTSI